MVVGGTVVVVVSECINDLGTVVVVTASGGVVSVVTCGNVPEVVTSA